MVLYSRLLFLLCCSAVQSCPTVCDPKDCSVPGFPVLHHLLELAQIHVHSVRDAIQPSHPLSSPSPAFNLSQHQGLFQWVSSSHGVAKVLEIQLQHQSFQWIFRIDFLDWLVWSPCSPWDSQESSPTPQLKIINSLCSAFFMIQLPHPYMTIGKTKALTRQTFVGKVMSLLFNMLSRFISYIGALITSCRQFLVSTPKFGAPAYISMYQIM